MNRILIFALACLSYGCSFPDFINHHEAFQREMDREVGRILDIPTSVMFSGKPNVKKEGGYEFEFENECRVFVEVEENTNKIHGWKYLSAPDRCAIVVNWLGPW